MSEAQQRLNPERLTTVLEAQRGIYCQMRALSERQKALVSQENVEPLLSLLAERQRLLDNLVKLNSELAPFRADWTNFYSGLSGEQRGRVAELLEEVNGSLGAILQGDSRDSATLTAKREGLVGDMASFDAGRRAGTAYAQSANRAPSGLTDARA